MFKRLYANASAGCTTIVQVVGDDNFVKVRQIKPTQLAFRLTIKVYLLNYLLTYFGDFRTILRLAVDMDIHGYIHGYYAGAPAN